MIIKLQTQEEAVWLLKDPLASCSVRGTQQRSAAEPASGPGPGSTALRSRSCAGRGGGEVNSPGLRSLQG